MLESCDQHRAAMSLEDSLQTGCDGLKAVSNWHCGTWLLDESDWIGSCIAPDD